MTARNHDSANEHPDAIVARWRDRLPRPAESRNSERPAGAQLVVERPRTVHEAAEELGLSVHTIRSWVAGRRIGHLRLGRVIRIPAAEIRRVIADSTIPARKET